MPDKVEYWLSLCDEDMSVADLLLKGNKYLQAGFFCHLVAEKALKAVISNSSDDPPPKVHKLKTLADKCGIFDDLSEEQLALLDELDPLNIEARYPEYKESIAKTLTKERTERIYMETEGFLCWIKKGLGR